MALSRNNVATTIYIPWLLSSRRFGLCFSLDRIFSAMGDPILIKDSDHVILRKGDFMKVFQLKSGREVWFAKKPMKLDGLIGHPYGSMFKLTDKQLQRIPFVGPEVCEIQESEAFRDNRFLTDDGKSQKLTKEDIDVLKNEGKSGEEIMNKLIENSSTFHGKTPFSREKYLKKKAHKYLHQFLVCKPSTRLLCELYHNKFTMTTLSLRMDSLAMVLAMANVRSGGRYMVLESCGGLMIGAVLERLGGHGTVVQLHTGEALNNYQIMDMYNFSEEERKCHHLLNVHDIVARENCTPDSSEIEVTNVQVLDKNIGDGCATDDVAENGKRKAPSEDIGTEKELRKLKRDQETQEAFGVIANRDMDGLIIATRFHPSNITQLLLKYLAWSRPFVLYSCYQEPLADCYQELKDSGRAVCLRLAELWHRKYQVLPNRTHPEVNMSGTGGYILSGIAVEKNCTDNE